MSNARRPRILYVSTPWPYMSIRALHVARALQHVGEVEVLIVDSEQLNCDSVDVLQKEFKLADTLNVIPRPVRRPLDKIRRALDPGSLYPHGVGVDEAGNRKLRRLMEDFDLIWFFKLRTVNMFDNWEWKHSVLDIDDVPSGVYSSILTSSNTFAARFGARLQILKWQRREQLLSHRFPVLTVCSEADKRLLSLQAPVHVIPNGFERPREAPISTPVTPPRIGFIGLFDYQANVHGIGWFLRNCWPRIKQDLPDARLRLVGRGSERLVGASEPDVDVLGWVTDASAEIATWSVMIVPLHIGGGQRVKVAEGFSRKCPVVSTYLGAYGYDVQSGRELLLADKPDDFAQACVSLIRDRAASSAMADRAYAAFLQNWTWDAIAPRVWAAAEDALAR